MGSDYESVMAVLGGFICVIGLIFLVLWILNIVGMWKTFTKAGAPGWAAIVPFYNIYTQIKLCGPDSMFFAWLGCWVVDFILTLIQRMIGGGAFIGFLAFIAGAALFVVNVFALYKLAKVFGKGIGFTVGLVLLQPIFIMILGFGSAEYDPSNVDMDSWVN